MASDINSRLAQLRTRRKGPVNLSQESLTKAGALNERVVLDEALAPEDWEKRGNSSQQWTRYVIGAMEAVGAKYTQVSKDTADKVANQLKDRLARAGIRAQFELQGSVPLNVHIKGVSDVDLLALSLQYRTYDEDGIKALQGGYTNSATMTGADCLRALRSQIEKDLREAYPAADLDITGAKAVKISGGSLARHVDVVPSHWYDTKAYQASQRQADRAVKIYDKKNHKTMANLPFLHIDRIATRCDTTRGGLRKAIRLCKNVKSDSDRDIQLSSYDLGAIMYHADTTALSGIAGIPNELAVLAETQRHLDALWQNPAWAETLYVPDGSRKIFDTPEKRGWLGALSMEMDDLLANVFSESAPGQLWSSSTPARKREVIKAMGI